MSRETKIRIISLALLLAVFAGIFTIMGLSDGLTAIEVDCYDKHNNRIVGDTCIQEIVQDPLNRIFIMGAIIFLVAILILMFIYIVIHFREISR